MGRLRRQRGEIPLDLVLIVVLVVAVGAALAWATWGSPFYTALIVVFVLGALVWTYARRIRRREDMSADQQRKVKHDASWTSGKEDE
jgi:uncharacterized membrane protein